MSQHPGVLVTLADDVDTATGEVICDLLRQIKGIADVALIDGDPTASRMAELRTDAAWRGRVLDLLKPKQ